ncbi:hypothetical protein YC2023_017374 [Brassica napus]
MGENPKTREQEHTTLTRTAITNCHLFEEKTQARSRTALRSGLGQGLNQDPTIDWTTLTQVLNSAQLPQPSSSSKPTKRKEQHHHS